MLKDIKEGLSGSRKPDITHVRSCFATYTARPCEYGEDKYERANYLRATGEGPHTEPTKLDFERFRKYLRAAKSHIMLVLDSMERHQANDPSLIDVEGMKKAAYAVDTDVTPGSKVGASLLPHVAPACSSLMMAIEQAVDCGLLPRDPGTPWRDEAKARAEYDKAVQDMAKQEIGLDSEIAMRLREKVRTPSVFSRLAQMQAEIDRAIEAQQERLVYVPSPLGQIRVYGGTGASTTDINEPQQLEPQQLELPLEAEPLPPVPVTVEEFDEQPTRVFKSLECSVANCDCKKTFPTDRDPADGMKW